MSLTRDDIYWESPKILGATEVASWAPALDEAYQVEETETMRRRGPIELPFSLRQEAIRQDIQRRLWKIGTELAVRGGVWTVDIRLYPALEEGRNCFIVWMILTTLAETKQQTHSLILSKLKGAGRLPLR